MATYLHPGVYVEEIPSGSRPIEASSTSVTAFVGRAPKGPVGEAVLIGTRDEYVRNFGDIASEDDAMGLAVRAFYLNGGKDAYICRLASEDPPTAAAASTVPGQDVGGQNVIEIRATSVGEWGNDVYYRVIKADRDALAFDLQVGHQEDGEFVVDETFSGLTMNDQDDDYALTAVNGNSDYVEIALEPAADADDDAEQYQQGSLTGGEMGGANDAFSANMSGQMSLTLNINGLGARQVAIDAGTLGLAGADNQTDGDAVAAAIQTAVTAFGLQPAYTGFTCGYAGQRFTLASGEEGPSSGVTVYDGDGAAADLGGFLRLSSLSRATLAGAALDDANMTLFSTGIAGTVTLELNVDDHGNETISLVDADLGLEGDHNADAGRVARAVRDAVRAVNTSVTAYKDFDCQYDAGANQFTLTSGSSASRSSSLTVTDGALANLLGFNAGDSPTLVEGREIEHGTARVIPQQVLGTLEAGEQLEDGGEAAPASADYSSFFNQTLRKIRDASIIVLPGEHWADDGSGSAIVSAALAHCEAMRNRILLVSPPPNVEFEQAAQVDQMALPTSTYSVLYYPWIKVANPFYNAETNPNADTTLTIAPSAFAAGMMAKIDGRRGVWKAPAGVETQLLGIAGLEFTVEDGEQDQLNPLGVNCIRTLPGFGSVIWGSRTLSTKADPEWRYVPVRRTAIFIERSIYEGIQWAVFEPNDHRLWASLRTNIDSFMNGLFRGGAFQGEKSSDAYFVRCGLGDTMTQGDIDRGQVIVIVGFAPLKPAEFVIVRIQQKVAQQ